MVLQLALYFLSRTNKTFRWPLWLLVIVSGLLGSFVLAPLYWLIGEGLMLQTLGFAATNDDDFDATLGFGLSAVLHEFVDIVAPVTAAWLVVSWPRLQGLIPPLVVQNFGSVGENTKESQIADEPAVARSWRSAIPRELGDDLIAVKSELQYLRVFTARGSALILGALQEIEDAEGQNGMRVHRSWWVHTQHIQAVQKKGDAAVCVLSDGREIPVSRRRKADVLAALEPTANP
jgi:DNA-binding LytR/AlgR family response regulator